MSVKPHFDATLTINATLPSNSLRFTVASVPRRFAEKSYAPFMTTASTARREETDAWREPELSANPLADETKSVPAARRRSINLETAFLDLHFPGLCRFLGRTGSLFTPADEAWQGKKDRFGTNASQDAIAAQIRYLVYLRTRHIHVSMHMSPYLLGHHHHSYLHYLPHIHIACTCAMPTSTCPREAARRSRDADAARSRLQSSAAS